MNKDFTSRVLFVVLLVAVLVSAYLVVAPFVAGFMWAAVLVAAFRPFHSRLQRLFGGRQTAATAAVTLIVAAFVVVPILVAAAEAVQAIISATNVIADSYKSGGVDLGLGDRWPWLADVVDRAKNLVGLANIDLKATALTAIQRIGTFIATEVPALVGGALGVLFSFLVMLIAMPLLFSYGEQLGHVFADTLPVGAADARRIVDELTMMTRSVFISTVLTSASQAALGGIALFVLGVPHAMPLTAVMFFASLIPGGTGFVWVPAAVWLFATGHTWKAVLLAAWGAGVVSTIDSVLRPLFAGKGSALPRVLLFLGMFGGMLAFGLVGLFIGPIVLYMALELLTILRRDEHTAPASPA